MANKKISQLTPKGNALAGTDLVEVSVFNGVTYDTKSLTGANILSGTGLTVGTTAIASGTVGRVLFEGTGNVVQQDSTLFWDNTNKRLGVGATPDTSTVLDVRSAGTLATDLAFRVRNSANTANLYQAQGDGQHWFNPFQTSESVNDVIIGGSNLASSKGGLRIATGNGALTLIGRSNTQNPSIISGNGNFAFETVANGTFAYAQFNVSVAQASNVYITTLASNTNQNSGIRLSAGGNKGLFLGVVGTDFLNINTTSGSVNIGYGSTLNSNAKLDVKAGGALSTDIAFRVRNSANSANLVDSAGNGSFFLRANSGDMHFNFDPVGNRIHLKRTGVYTITTDNAVTELALSCNTGSISIRGGSKKLHIYNAGNFHLGSTSLLAGSGNGNLIFQNGTAPSTNLADRHYYYSADVVAGNAAPHFRTENGAVVKLYQETTAVTSAAFVSNSGTTVHETSTFDGYTLQQIVKALRNTGLLA